MRKVDGRRLRCLEAEMECFDEAGFEMAVRKIRTCILRGEPQQAHKVLEEFIGKPNTAVLTHETHVSELGLNPQLSSILANAGYINYGSLRVATDSELVKIPGVALGSLAEIRGVLGRLKPHVFTR
jgi:hypothetical protein